jgi:hypothetical protein
MSLQMCIGKLQHVLIQILQSTSVNIEYSLAGVYAGVCAGVCCVLNLTTAYTYDNRPLIRSTSKTPGLDKIRKSSQQVNFMATAQVCLMVTDLHNVIYVHMYCMYVHCNFIYGDKVYVHTYM